MTSFNPQTTLLGVALECELPRDVAVGWQIVLVFHVKPRFYSSELVHDN